MSVLWGVCAASGCSGDSETSANPPDRAKDGGVSGAAADAEVPCAPTTCAKSGATCGTMPDGCGGVLDCGTCPSGSTCGGDGANRCGLQACSPRTCAQMGASCGYVSDGCSAALNCGDCVAPLSCGGSGVANLCGMPADGQGGSSGKGGSAGSSGAAGAGDTTWCYYDISPKTGYPSTAFSWTAQSNGTSCEWTVDGVLKGSCDCNFDGSFLGSDVGVGTHTTVFHVRQGPGGPKDCSAFVEVKEETTCTHVISPSSGYPSTSFSWKATSNGTSCTWVLDGVPKGASECNFDTTFLGSDVGIGTHTAILKIVEGPSGPKECAASVDIKEETWCKHTITPGSGSLSTAFTWQASSNGTSCEWTLDGVNKGPCQCNFDGSFLGSDVGVGNHAAVLKVLQGPSGPKDCPASVTIN